MGFLKWFNSKNKLKRWIFLTLVGMALVCYSIANILVLKEMSFDVLAKIIIVFVLGIVATVFGLIGFYKRTLEILIESTDERMKNGNNVNVKSLIFNKKVYHQGPNIVVIGGGTGLNTVLYGLKKYTDNLTAIVTISDYGEIETESRKELQTMPLDDVKDSIIALAANDNQMDKLFNYKFQDGRLNNLKFSDIYFKAMKNINDDFEKSVAKSNEILNITGKVLPVTLDKMNITAELENGYLVTDRSKIPEIVYEKVTKINRIFLNPTNCRPAPGVVEAIKNADCIIIGPGSLYTNVIPNLLVNGVAKTIKESTGLKVYISNIMTEPGQTDEYSVSDHINAIIDHVGKGIIDYCIYDTGEIVPEFVKKYNLEGQDLVDPNIEKVKGITFLQRNLSMISTDGHIRHDPNLVAESIIELICDDLKYQDKQNDPQYLMLNNKLKEDKRINKIKKQMKHNAKQSKDKNKVKKAGNSKFISKYDERLKSIRQADEMVKIKEKKLKEEEKKEKEKKKAAEKEKELKQIENLLKEKKKTMEEEKVASKIRELPKSQRGRHRKK